MQTFNAGYFSRTAALLLCTSAATLAQAQTAADETADVKEIIVTATKRAESVQDIPIAVSAIGGDLLARSRVTQVDELVNRTPNLQLTSTVGSNTPIFALRGVSMSDYSLNQSSPVATYYDEVYKGNFALLGVALFDLERVEVLRGPQGTLFGKNTTGGAVNLISRAPKLGITSGYLNVGYGNYNRFDVNGAINVPLGDKLALRVAGTWSKADGWFKNVVPGKEDLEGVSEYGIRAALRFEPSDGIDITLRGSTSFQNPTNYGIFARPAAVNRPGLGDREIAANVDDKRRARTWSLSLTANVEVSDTLTLTSITALDKGDLSFFEDTDGQSIQLLEIPYVARAEQFAQDLRLTSDFGGAFNFILGAYFHRESVFNETTFQIGNDIDFDGVPGVTDADCAIGLPLACQFNNSFDQLKKSFAIYTDINFALSDALSLRGGLRYTHDTGKQTDFRSDALGPNGVLVVNLIPPSDLKYKTDNLSGKIGLDYKFDNGQLLYGNYSRGYRANSFNAQAFFDPSELSVADFETIDAFEIGLKSQFADRRVTLNLAAFYYKYTNQQFLNVDPITAAQTLLNIPKSTIYGAEAELLAHATDALTLRGGLGLLSTKIDEGIVSGVNVNGNNLSNAPSLSFNVGFDATVMDGDRGRLSLHGDLSYAGAQFFEVLNIPRLEQGSYALLGGHIDWQSANGRWNASVWAKNLTNEFYFTSRVDLLAGFGFDYNHVAAPRTFGITAGTKF